MPKLTQIHVHVTRIGHTSSIFITNNIMKVKNDHRSEFSNLSNWKEEA